MNLQERRTRAPIRYLDPPEPAWITWGPDGVVGSSSLETEWFAEPIMRRLHLVEKR